MSLLDQLLPFPPSLSLQLPEFNQLIQQLAFGNLKHWESASYLLFKSGRIQDFLQLMNVITSKIIDKDHDEGSKQTKIRIYNYLSIYYLIQASKAENNEKAQEQFEVVIKNFNLSDRYDFDGLTFNIKGLFSFYKGDQNQSLEYYKTSLGKILPDEKVSTVFPLIGTAQVYFAIGEYKESLVYFKKVIKLRPNVPGKVRLGMAYCFFQLEQYTLAYYTFLRVLQLEPQNVEAIIGLAVLCYNKGDYDGYFQRLIQAFNINKNNPVILYYLAEHYLFQQQYDRCQKCIKNGLKALDLVSRVQFKEKANELKFRNDWSNLKGRFLYLWGFIKQINGDFESAYKIYNQSKQFNRNNPLVLYALSQIFIHSQYLNYVESNKLLQEKVMKIYENSYFMHEIQRTIAYIYSKCLNDKKMILNAYKKALQYNPDDCETLIEYAQQIDDDATVYYQRAEKILENKQLFHQNQYCFQQQTEQVIFPELYINMGVLQQTLNPQEALKCFKKCEQLLEVFKIPDYVVETNEETTTQEVQLKKNLYQIMLFYNMGIVNEQLGDFVQAEENWKQCIQINPYFVDAYIRLSYLYFELGNADLALEQLNNGQIQFEQVIQHNKIYKQYNPIPMMYGYISAQTFDDVTAKEQFKANLEDCYSKFCLMAHDYQMAADRNKNTDHSFLKSVLRQLAQSSLKILQYDQKNIQAAMIVILIIAEVGQLQQALSQLENLQEYSNVQPRILSNLAILEYMIGNEENYQPAKLYFKKFYEKTNYKPDEHTDLSVAQMHLNYNNYKDAANTIKRCIINNPSQMRHRLNLYIVIHQQCYEILENPKFKYNLRLLSSAIQYFKILMRSYEYMYRGTCWQSRDQQYRAQLRPYIRQQQFQIIREKCEDRYNYINTYQMNFDRFLRDAQEYEKQQKIKQEQIELERKKRLQEAQQKEQEQQQNIIDEEKAAQLELLQQQFLEQMKRDKELAEEERKQSKGKRLTKQDKKRIEKEKEEEEAFLESEDDESYNSNQALRDEQKMKQDLGDSEEDLKEQEEYEKKGKTPKLKKQKKQQKQNIKQKSRLQKQEDLEDEQIFESKSEEKQDDYDVFN